MVLLDKPPVFIHNQLSNAVRGQSVSLRSVQILVNQFKTDRTSTADEERSGLPRTSTDSVHVNMVNQLLAEVTS